MAFSSKRVISSNFSSGSSTTTQSQLIRGTMDQIIAISNYGLWGAGVYWKQNALNSDVGVTDWNSMISRAQSLGIDTSQWDGTTLAHNDRFFGWFSWASNDPSNPTQSQGISAAWTDNPPWLPIPVTIKKVEYYASWDVGTWHFYYGHDNQPSTFQTTSQNIFNDSSAYTTNANDLNSAMGSWYQYWRGSASNNTCDFIFDIQHPPI